MPSPMPIYAMGTLSIETIGKTMPPFEVPSNFVMTRSVTSVAS